MPNCLDVGIDSFVPLDTSLMRKGLVLVRRLVITLLSWAVYLGASVWAHAQSSEASPSAPMFQACAGKNYAVKFKRIDHEGETHERDDFSPYLERFVELVTQFTPNTLRNIIDVLKAGEDVSRTAGFDAASIRIVFLEYPDFMKYGAKSFADPSFKFVGTWDKTLRSPWVQVGLRSAVACDMDITVIWNLRQLMFDQFNLESDKVNATGLAAPLVQSRSGYGLQYTIDFFSVLTEGCVADDAACEAEVRELRFLPNDKGKTLIEHRRDLSKLKLEKSVSPDIYWLYEHAKPSGELLNFGVASVLRDLVQQSADRQPISVRELLNYFLTNEQKHLDLQDVMDLRRVLPRAVYKVELLRE